MKGLKFTMLAASAAILTAAAVSSYAGSQAVPGLSGGSASSTLGFGTPSISIAEGGQGGGAKGGKGSGKGSKKGNKR